MGKNAGNRPRGVAVLAEVLNQVQSERFVANRPGVLAGTAAHTPQLYFSTRSQERIRSQERHYYISLKVRGTRYLSS